MKKLFFNFNHIIKSFKYRKKDSQFICRMKFYRFFSNQFTIQLFFGPIIFSGHNSKNDDQTFHYWTNFYSNFYVQNKYKKLQSRKLFTLFNNVINWGGTVFFSEFSFIHSESWEKILFFVTIYRWHGQSHRWWNKNHCTYISINLTLIIDEMREKESVRSINPNLISYVLLGDCCVYNFVVVLFGSICSIYHEILILNQGHRRCVNEYRFFSIL